MVRYNCIYCKHIYNHKGNYLTHNIRCKELFELQIIKYKSYTIYNLINEICDLVNCKNNNVEIDNKKYKCKKCEKSYFSYNGLKKHKLKYKKEIEQKK